MGEAELDDEEDEFPWQKLVLRLMIPDDQDSDDGEEMAEELAEIVDPIISESSLGEIIGFECAGDDYIDILIFGKPTNSDIEEIYELVAPSFREFGCPPGSRIIRCYNEPDEEVESDIVEKKSRRKGGKSKRKKDAE